MLCQVYLRFMGDQLLIELRHKHLQKYSVSGVLYSEIFKSSHAKKTHTLVHRFPLLVDSISFVLYDCWYSIHIGTHKLCTHFLLEFGPFFFGKRLKLGQVGWFLDHDSGRHVIS